MQRKHGSILVVGGGISGFSLASHASRFFDVTLVEAEFQPGYHSTGRSAASFHIAFENLIVHELSLSSESFFLKPPRGFEQLASPLPHMMVARPSEHAIVGQFLDTWSGRCPWLRLLQRKDIEERIHVLASEYSVGSLDERSLSLEVHNLLDGYRRNLLENQGMVLTQRRLDHLDDSKGYWTAAFDEGDEVHADVVVNAAGAWADHVAEIAGVNQLGLVPKRRTGLRIHAGIDSSKWPMCYLASGGLYFKSEGESLMLSPVDATPSPPCDAQPEILDVATALDRFNSCTTLRVDQPDETWAGLRTFFDDGAPVVGYAHDHPGFFWHAAFGGFGVQTSPACGQIASELLRDKPSQAGAMFDLNDISPVRCSTS